MSEDSFELFKDHPGKAEGSNKFSVVSTERDPVGGREGSKHTVKLKNPRSKKERPDVSQTLQFKSKEYPPESRDLVLEIMKSYSLLRKKGILFQILLGTTKKTKKPIY